MSTSAETKYVVASLERNIKAHYKHPIMEGYDSGFNAGFKRATILSYMALADDEYEWHIEQAREYADNNFNIDTQEDEWQRALDTKHEELVTQTVNGWISAIPHEHDDT